MQVTEDQNPLPGDSRAQPWADEPIPLVTGAQAGVLPPHLIEDVIAVGIDRGDGDVALTLRAAQDVRSEQDHVRGLDGFCPNSENKIAAPSRATITFKQSYAPAPPHHALLKYEPTRGAYDLN